MLTIVVWWFEVRFNKGATFVFFFFCFFLPTTVSFIGLLFVFDKITLFNVGLALVLSFSLGAAFAGPPILMAWLRFTDGVIINFFKESKCSPNKNRFNGWVWRARATPFLFLFVLLSIVIIEGQHKDLSFFASPTVGVLLLASSAVAAMYTLCVEPIPPQEKEKRKAKKNPSVVETSQT